MTFFKQISISCNSERMKPSVLLMVEKIKILKHQIFFLTQVLLQIAPQFLIKTPQHSKQ